LPQTSRIPHKAYITAIPFADECNRRIGPPGSFWGLCSKFGNSLADATHRGVPVSASQPRRVASDRHCGQIPGDDVYEVALGCELFWLQPLASFDWERASKCVRVHLGRPLRHPSTLLGGRAFGGAAETFAMFAPQAQRGPHYMDICPRSNASREWPLSFRTS